MIRIIFLIFIFSAVPDVFSSTTFYSTLGTSEANEMFFSVVQMDNGEFVAGGYSSSYFPDNSFLLARFTKKGEIVWSKTYCIDDEDSDCYGYRVSTSEDGGIYLVGDYNNVQSVLIKVSSDGTFEWTTYIGDSSSEWGNGAREAKEMDDGTIVVLSYTLSISEGAVDGVLSRLTSTGVLSIYNSFGTTFDDFGYSFLVDDFGSFYVSGYANNDEVTIFKFDENLELEWSKSFDAIGGSSSSIPFQIIPAGTGTDMFLFGRQEGIAFLIRMDSDGEKVWGTLLGGLDDVEAKFNGGCVSSDGNVIIAIGSVYNFGHGSSDFLVVKFDESDGSVDWAKVIGTSLYERAWDCVIDTSDDGIVVVGEGSDVSDRVEAVIFKLDKDGNVTGDCIDEIDIMDWETYTVTPINEETTDTIGLEQENLGLTSDHPSWTTVNILSDDLDNVCYDEIVVDDGDDDGDFDDDDDESRSCESFFFSKTTFFLLFLILVVVF